MPDDTHRHPIRSCPESKSRLCTLHLSLRHAPTDLPFSWALFVPVSLWSSRQKADVLKIIDALKRLILFFHMISDWGQHISESTIPSLIENPSWISRNFIKQPMNTSFRQLSILETIVIVRFRIIEAPAIPLESPIRVSRYILVKPCSHSEAFATICTSTQVRHIVIHQVTRKRPKLQFLSNPNCCLRSVCFATIQVSSRRKRPSCLLLRCPK